MKDFHQLEVWRQAHNLALEIYQATSNFPKEEKYSLTDQIRRASVSISANLAEGCGRDSDPDFARFVQIAFGSACELEALLLLAKDLNLISTLDHQKIENNLISIKRMLAGLLKKLRAES